MLAPAKPARLSVIVITKNETLSIARCLGSVGFADEIIVVDSGSTDDTAAQARGLGAQVIATADWPGFGPQKNRALDAATGDFVLSLDADEWIEPELAQEICAVLANPDALNGYEMPRRSRFCGRIVRHCGWWPDYVTRLFRRGHARFSDDLVHERVIVEGQTGRLRAPIEHDSITSLDDAADKIERYARAGALGLIARGKRASLGKARARGAAAFAKTLILRAGLLDGATGWQVALYNARYTYRKWLYVARPPAG